MREKFYFFFRQNTNQNNSTYLPDIFSKIVPESLYTACLDFRVVWSTHLAIQTVFPPRKACLLYGLLTALNVIQITSKIVPEFALICMLYGLYRIPVVRPLLENRAYCMVLYGSVSKFVSAEWFALGNVPKHF